MGILITGGLGFLGSNLCYEFLKEKRGKVVAYDIVYRFPNFLKEYEHDDNFVFVRGDMTDGWNLLGTVQKYQVTEIVHTATVNTEKGTIQRPYQCLSSNILGAIQLLEIARSLRLRRLICISSRSAYGACAPVKGPITEDFPFNPLGFYGASKACVDVILPQYRAHHNVDAVSLRVTSVFGPGQGEGGAGPTGIPTTPIYNILACVLQGRPYYLPSGADHYLEVTYVRELVRGIKLILDAEKVRYPIYNVSYGRQFKISELAAMVKDVLPESEIRIGPGLMENVELRAAMDNRRVTEEFGYAHAPLQECIKDFVQYLRSTG